VPEPEVVEEPPAPEVVFAAASESKTEIPAAAQKSRSDVAEERATGPDKVEAPAPQGQVPAEESQPGATESAPAEAGEPAEGVGEGAPAPTEGVEEPQMAEESAVPPPEPTEEEPRDAEA